MNKTKTLLQPSIESIESDLFAPSTNLINQWVNGELSDAEEQSLHDNPLAQQRREGLNDNEMADELTNEVISNVKMPSYLANLVDRHLAAKNTFADVNDFESGQIRLIESLPNQLHHKPEKKLAVLLVEKVETLNGLVWRGYMTASETAWASYWDMLLEADIDEPFDPIVGMIQIWNSVNFDEKNLGKVVAELSKTRLATVRALKEEYLLGDDLDPSQAMLGKVYGRETVDRISVLTGSPLALDDPRHRYQLLYHTVAKVLSVPVMVEVEEFSSSSVFEQFLQRLKSFTEQIGTSLIPQDNVAYAMGDTNLQEDTKIFLYNDCLELKLMFDDGLISIQAKVITERKCSISIIQNDDILEEKHIGEKYCLPLEISNDDEVTLRIQCQGSDNIEIKFPLLF